MLEIMKIPQNRRAACDDHVCYNILDMIWKIRYWNLVKGGVCSKNSMIFKCYEKKIFTISAIIVKELMLRDWNRLQFGRCFVPHQLLPCLCAANVIWHDQSLPSSKQDEHYQRNACRCQASIWAASIQGNFHVLPNTERSLPH